MELTLTYNKFRSVSGHFGDWVVQRMNTILLLFGTGMVEVVVSLFNLRRAAFTFSTARISWSEKVVSVLSRSPPNSSDLSPHLSLRPACTLGAVEHCKSGNFNMAWANRWPIFSFGVLEEEKPVSSLFHKQVFDAYNWRNEVWIVRNNLISFPI